MSLSFAVSSLDCFATSAAAFFSSSVSRPFFFLGSAATSALSAASSASNRASSASSSSMRCSIPSGEKRSSKRWLISSIASYVLFPIPSPGFSAVTSMPVSALMIFFWRRLVRCGLLSASMSIALPSAWLLQPPLEVVRGLKAQQLLNGLSLWP